MDREALLERPSEPTMEPPPSLLPGERGFPWTGLTLCVVITGLLAFLAIPRIRPRTPLETPSNVPAHQGRTHSSGSEPDPLTSPRQRAFTILELCLVLVIITIVACLAITTFFSRHEVTLENASKLLEDDLRSAKHSAAIRHAPIHVEFSTTDDGYRVFDSKGKALPNPAGGGPFERRYDFDAVFEGVEIHSLRADEESSAEQTLTFDANGRPTTGFQIVLEFAQARQLIELLPHTGEIRVHPPNPTAD